MNIYTIGFGFFENAFDFTMFALHAADVVWPMGELYTNGETMNSAPYRQPPRGFQSR